MADTDFHWDRHPAGERLLARALGSFTEGCPPLQRLEQELTERAGGRLADWVDHLVLADGEEPRAGLRAAGFVAEADGGGPPAEGTPWRHPGALFPPVVLRASRDAPPGTTLTAALAVEEAALFQLIHGADGAVEGSPLAPYRRARVWHSAPAGKAARELWVAERRGTRGLLPETQPAEAARLYREAYERWAARPRALGDVHAGMAAALGLARELAAELGPGRAAWAVLEAERARWQARSRAGRVQRGRQDALGLGWANQDHHTFRSSREAFAPLIRVLETLGFRPRERFYAGEEAGWGAQILEHPDCPLTVFADVDLDPQEVGVDFAYAGLPPRERLGTVGLWCALHGESLLEAGLHHLAARLDFSRARIGLQREGVRLMAPFSRFPHLRQAFSRGEVWAVEESRLRRLRGSRRGGGERLSEEQLERFAREGAIGSHLENIQRGAGFKGFNSKSVSDIIRRTDPRLARARGA